MRSFTCPACKGDTVVKDSRAAVSGIRRRRHCLVCRHRFSTMEKAVGTAGQFVPLLDEISHKAADLARPISEISAALALVSRLTEVLRSIDEVNWRK